MENLNEIILDFLKESNLRAVEEGDMKPLMAKTLALIIFNNKEKINL